MTKIKIFTVFLFSSANFTILLFQIAVAVCTCQFAERKIYLLISNWFEVTCFSTSSCSFPLNYLQSVEQRKTKKNSDSKRIK